VETISLCGGPGDGQVFEWDGGDLLRYFDLRAASHSSGEEVRVTLLPRSAEHFYRRSTVTPAIFVFQP